MPQLVRHVDLLGRSGVVLYSQLTADTADAAIDAQIAYFASLGQSFEWKVYSHDRPPDLVERLARRGLAIDEREAVMVLDVNASHVPRLDNPPIGIRRVLDAEGLALVGRIKQRVYRKDATDLLARLAHELEHTPDDIAVYLADDRFEPAACAWIRFPERRAFASLWGGTTLPEHRNQGLYTTLVWVRANEARLRGYRYVTVDAGAMSRPILGNLGFRTLTWATACTWSPPATHQAAG